jgi:hypothetical protein
MVAKALFLVVNRVHLVAARCLAFLCALLKNLQSDTNNNIHVFKCVGTHPHCW